MGNIRTINNIEQNIKKAELPNSIIIFWLLNDTKLTSITTEALSVRSSIGSRISPTAIDTPIPAGEKYRELSFKMETTAFSPRIDAYVTADFFNAEDK